MKLKEQPEDFQVEELIHLEEADGRYLYIKVKKRNLNTLDVVQILVKKLHIPRKNIGYAGAKDKRAITTQYFSLFDSDPERVNKLHIKNLELTPLYYGKKPISLGILEGNRFRIKIEEPVREMDFLVNYFGEQRFSRNNKDIGKALIMKDFKTSCALSDHPKIKSHLTEKEHDFIGALQKVEKKLLLLWVHAYQSYLWNEVVKQYLKKYSKEWRTFENYVFVKEKDSLSIPLLGFDTIFTNKNIETLYKKLLADEKVAIRDFILRSFPESMPISTEREVFVEVKNFRREESFVEFTLPKGSYATVFLKQLESFL